jgi:hypothetical protein
VVDSLRLSGSVRLQGKCCQILGACWAKCQAVARASQWWNGLRLNRQIWIVPFCACAGKWKGVTVAVKIVEHNQETESNLNQLRESLLSSNIVHPNVVRLPRIKTPPQCCAPGAQPGMSAVSMSCSPHEAGCVLPGLPYYHVW